jgi:cytochrome c oxidase subunit I
MDRPRTPLLFALGAIAALALAIGELIGIAGLYGGTDRVLHDTYYVVAHTSYALKLVALFAILALWYFAFPRVTGWTYSDRLGKVHFGLWAVGTIASSLPLVIVPRLLGQLADELDVLWRWNLVAAIGTFFIAAGGLVFVVNMVMAFIRRRRSS